MFSQGSVSHMSRIGIALETFQLHVFWHDHMQSSSSINILRALSNVLIESHDAQRQSPFWTPTPMFMVGSVVRLKGYKA